MSSKEVTNNFRVCTLQVNEKIRKNKLSEQ